MRRKLLAGLLASTCLIGLADAAVTPNSVVTAQTPKSAVIQFLQGTDSAGTYKILYTGGANGSICKALLSTNNDAGQTHLITVQIVHSTVFYGGTALTTVSNAGYANATPPQNLLSSTVWPGLPTDQNQNPYILLNSGDTIQATFATALTASDWINLYISCGDF